MPMPMNLPPGEGGVGFSEFLGGAPAPAPTGGLASGMGDVLRPGLELAQMIIGKILEEMSAPSAPPLPKPAPSAESATLPKLAGAGMAKGTPMGGNLPKPGKTPGF